LSASDDGSMQAPEQVSMGVEQAHALPEQV
jgi:hypothetical protein